MWRSNSETLYYIYKPIVRPYTKIYIAYKSFCKTKLQKKKFDCKYNKLDQKNLIFKMLAVQNILASFCCLLEKRHFTRFFLLGSLSEQL